MSAGAAGTAVVDLTCDSDNDSRGNHGEPRNKSGVIPPSAWLSKPPSKPFKIQKPPLKAVMKVNRVYYIDALKPKKPIAGAVFVDYYTEDGF